MEWTKFTKPTELKTQMLIALPLDLASGFIAVSYTHLDVYKRQIITSCGYAVPQMELVEQRDILVDWADKKGEEGIKNYWKEKNQKSFDGFETKVPID